MMMTFMTSFSLNSKAAHGASDRSARASDHQAEEASGEEFGSTLAAAWFVPPVSLPPVSAKPVSAESSDPSGAQAEPANAAGPSETAAGGAQIRALRESLAGIADLLTAKAEPAPATVATITITNPMKSDSLLTRATDSFDVAADESATAAKPLPETLATKLPVADEASPDQQLNDRLAKNSAPGEDPLVGYPIDKNSTPHPLPWQGDAPTLAISNTVANVMSKLNARLAATDPTDATTEQDSATAEMLATNTAADRAASHNQFNDRGLPDAAHGEDPLVGHPIDANSAPRFQPRPVDNQAAQTGDAMAKRMNLSKINSLISMATAQTGAALAANQDSFAQSKSRQHVVESSNSEIVQNEKTAQASLLETVFRELVGEPISESSSASLKVDPAALSTARGAGATDDNPHSLDHMTQTDAGSFALASGTPAEGRGTTITVANQTAALTQQVINPLIEMARSLAQQQTRALRIQLQPDNFGQINLKITRDVSGRLSAHLMAESTVTRHALAEGISGLREALEQSGLLVDHLDVSLALNAQGQPGSHTTSENEAGSATLPTARRLAAESSATADAQPTTRIEPRRLLNLRI